jgi:2-haloalkanoic acid dehalogenase type II
VLLDFYCTLVDLGEPVRSRGFDDLARRLGLPLGPGELYRRYAEMISSEPEEDGTSGFVPYRQSWLAAGRRLLAPFGCESAAEQFADAYAGMHATALIFPDVPDALRALTRDFRMGVVANADHDYLMRCLDHNGLGFDVLVDSETAGCYKPEPRIFHQACHALSVAAAEAVMVGDTPETDVRGAHRAGLRAVWLNGTIATGPAAWIVPMSSSKDSGSLSARPGSYPQTAGSTR